MFCLEYKDPTLMGYVNWSYDLYRNSFSFFLVQSRMFYIAPKN